MHRSVSSRDHNISYRVEGTGRPLMLLCGWSQWADQWWDRGYLPALAADYRVIAVDRLGHGRSDKPHDASLYDERLITRDLIAVLDAEEIEQIAVWGFSLGAKNALSLAVTTPQRVSALVRGSAPPEFIGDRAPRYLALAEQVQTLEGAKAFWTRLGLTEPEAVDEAIANNDITALAATARGTAEWWPDITQLNVPSLWYIGANEAGFNTDELAHANKQGIETRLIADADHLQAFNRSADALDIVIPFLAAN